MTEHEPTRSEKFDLIKIASPDRLRATRDAVLNQVLRENHIDESIVREAMHLLCAGRTVPAEKARALRELADEYEAANGELRIAFEEHQERMQDSWDAALRRYHAMSAVSQAAEDSDSATGVSDVFYEADAAATGALTALLKMADRILRGQTTNDPVAGRCRGLANST